MKKLWLMLLIGCAVSALSACSNDDPDSPSPTNPITDCVITSPADIGGTLTITGKGFAPTTGKVYLKNSTGAEALVTDLQATTTGVEGTIPGTLAEGVYRVVLVQNGTWDLGQVRLQAPQNPITGLKMPTAIKLNKALEIAGSGFGTESKLFLESTDAAKTRTELTVTVTPQGISGTLPSGIAAGSYNVIHQFNSFDWLLAENLPAAVYKQLKEVKSTVAETYPEITEALVRKALAAMGMAPSPEEVTDEQLAQMGPMIEAMCVSGTTVSSIINVLAEGRVTAIQGKTGDAAAADRYTFAYANDQITGTNVAYDEETNDPRSFTWTAQDGKVIASSVVRKSKTYEYTWIYNDADQLISTDNSPEGGPYRQFVFTTGNLTSVQGDSDPAEMFEYKQAAWKNNIFGADAAKLILLANDPLNGGLFGQDILFANLLGLDGKASTNLPSAFLTPGTGMPQTLTYTYDNDGYVTSINWSVSGFHPYFTVIPYENTTKIEFTYE